MKPSTHATLPLAALVGVAFATGSAAATIILTTAISGPNNPSTKADEVAFAAAVSSSDLLHGLTGTGGRWNANGSDPAASSLRSSAAEPGGQRGPQENLRPLEIFPCKEAHISYARPC
ncbi:MAG: hypothetical protein NTW21_34775 [Verrucomicrobia bacterium]|nr:hypothetical protein [Verrucomicrobiota bacterium]